MKNHSSLMSAEGCISPAFTDFSPDEIIATAKQDRSARRTIGQRSGPLLYWLAAFFSVAGPVLGASQADLQPALAQFSQDGSKLVGAFAVGLGQQGWSVALSADGNTAIVGGAGDNRITGAAWVFTRSNGVWTQQGSKLVGTGAVEKRRTRLRSRCPATATPPSWAGLSTTRTGAAWVFTRSGGVWTQQGNKLVGTGAVGPAKQGASVALSADGNTAIVGGPSTTGTSGRRGSSPAAAASGPSRAASWSAPARWDGRTRLLRRAVCRRQHRHRGRACLTTRRPGRRGSSAAAMVSGPSRATSWSAPARLGTPDKAPPSRCLPTATPPSWAGLLTTRTLGRRGSTPAAGLDQRAPSWSAPARLETPTRLLRRAVRRWQHRHRGRR